jgi:hypothetical protein
MATRRYRAIGGVYAWRLPVVAGIVLAVAALAADWITTVVVAALALVAGSIERGTVFEVSPYGLSTETRIGGVSLHPARAIPWHAIEDVTTRWRRPRDCSNLETLVRGGGTVIRLSNVMGYGGYRALVTDIVTRAPHACRGELTEQLLAEPAPAPPRLRAAAIAVVLLVLAIWAVV